MVVMDLVFIGLAVLINLAVTVVGSIRYKIVLHDLGSSISLAGSFLVMNAAQFSSYITPMRIGGIISKPHASKIIAGVKARVALFATLIEQAFDLSWQIILLPFLLILIGNKSMGLNLQVVILILFLLTALGAFLKRRMIISILFRFSRFLPGFVKRHAKGRKLTKKRILRLVGKTSSYLNVRMVLKLAIPTIITMIVAPFSLMFVARSVLVTITFGTAFVSILSSTIIGRLSGVPGGFGVREVSLAGFLIFFGIDPILAAEIAVLNRVASALVVVVFGAPALAYVVKNIKRAGGIPGL